MPVYKFFGKEGKTYKAVIKDERGEENKGFGSRIPVFDAEGNLIEGYTEADVIPFMSKEELAKYWARKGS